MQSYLVAIRFRPQGLAHPSNEGAVYHGSSHSYVFHLNNWYVFDLTLFNKSTSLVFLQ